MRRKLVIIIIAIIVISLVSFGIFFIADGRLKLYKMNRERINNCTTLSKYIKYHDLNYMTVASANKGAEYHLYFDAQDIKLDALNEKSILYYNRDFISDITNKGLLILDDYTIYETAFNSDKTYSNGQQYKQIETDIEIKRIQIHYNSPYFVSQDNKYYEINKEKSSLEEIEYSRDAWSTYAILKDETVQKVISTYYNKNINRTGRIVLKNDGQVYIQYYEDDKNLAKEELLLSNNEYGHIIDIEHMYRDFINDNTITKVLSNNGLYYLKQTSEQQYIDTEPTYELVLSDIYDKYKSDIKYIDTNYVFTIDNNIIRTDMLCRDIDKEVK